MAEIMLRDKLRKRKIKWFKISSAGLNVTEERINVFSEKILKQRGLDCSSFKPRQLDGRVADKAHAVVCMTEKQKKYLSDENTYCIKDFYGKDIPDPYGMGEEAYIHTANVLDVALEKVIESLVLPFIEG